MAYDCINGWSDIIEALELDLEAEGIDGDDAQEVATLALDRIAQLQRTEANHQVQSEVWEALCMSLDIPTGGPKEEALDVGVRVRRFKETETAARLMLAALKEAHAFMQDRDRLDFVQPRERTYRAARAIAAAEAAGIKTTVEG